MCAIRSLRRLQCFEQLLIGALALGRAGVPETATRGDHVLWDSKLLRHLALDVVVYVEEIDTDISLDHATDLTIEEESGVVVLSVTVLEVTCQTT